MQRAAILHRGSVAPLAAVVVCAWVLLAALPMSHAAASFPLGWAAMCAAMMLPTVFGAGEFAAAGSAVRASAFAVGYLAVWICTAPLAFVLLNGVSWTPLVLMVAAVAVGIYQFTPVKRRALAKCHERRRCGRPLVFGAKQGVACVAACFPLMVLTMAALSMVHVNIATTLAVLLVVSALMTFEKLRPRSAMAIGVAVIAIASIAFVQVNPGGELTHLNEHQVVVSR